MKTVQRYRELSRGGMEHAQNDTNYIYAKEAKTKEKEEWKVQGLVVVEQVFTYI